MQNTAHRFPLFIAVISLIFLSACGIDRDSADAKLADACETGIKLFIAEGQTIKQVKSSNYIVPDLRSDGDRRVTLNVIESDGWYDADKSYACNFFESTGFMGMNYRASIAQIDMGDKIYGMKDGQIQGSYDEWLEITNTVDAALAQ